MMKSYETDSQFEKKANGSWFEYFEKLPQVKTFLLRDDYDSQTQGHWDAYAILKGGEIITIDLKTRTCQNYYDYYSKDNSLLIETWGNDTRIDDPGSSIFNSKADYWAYGWYCDNKISNPIIFERKPFCDYILPFINRFSLLTAPNFGYNTENRLIPRNHFKQFEVNNGEFL